LNELTNVSRYGRIDNSENPAQFIERIERQQLGETGAMSRKRRQNQRMFIGQVEACETRALMSVGLSRNGVLNIRGTTQNDSIEIVRSATDSNQLQVIENGKVAFKTDLKRVKSIRALALAGDDTFHVNEGNGKIAVNINFLGQQGNDTFKGGSARNFFDGGTGQNVIHTISAADRWLNSHTSDDVVKLSNSTDLRNFLTKAVRGRGWVGNRIRGEVSIVGTPVAMPLASPGAKVGGDVSSISGGGFSQTNTQVAGIDEADIIENNGESLFILSRGELLIVDARDADAMTVKSRTKIDGSAIAEYLDGNRLTVISSVWGDTQPGDGRLLPMLRIRTGGQVQVTVFDVTNTASPTVISKTQVDGWYSDSRMVDGKLALIVQNDLLAGYWGGYGGGINMIARPGLAKIAAPSVSNSALEQLLRKTSIDKILPSWTTTLVGPAGKSSSTGLISQPDSIYCPVTGMEANLMSVVLINTRAESPGVVGATSIMGGYSSSIFMNSKDLYVFSPRWDNLSGNRTGVQRFDITGTQPKLLATGSFNGHLVNQFAADASGEYLRVASTEWTPDGTTNSVYVLTTRGDSLDTVGSITGIAPGETIQSVRFMGDKAYVVTFKQVDPLFTIDLSSPTSPKIVGELKIPGFSRYLQPFGEGYIVGIGRDADPETGRTTGLKLSLFDVRDDNNPKELTSYLLGQPENGWQWSDAEWDHHALGYFPELGVLAVPVQGYVQADPATGPNGEWVPPKYQSDLVLFKIDTAGSITNIGTVEHDSSLLRSSRIGDVIYSVADLDLKAVQVITKGIAARGSLTLNEKQDDGGWVIAL
jgi:uncharacterized secreted protein with C-terminal beta-propeller domain